MTERDPDRLILVGKITGVFGVEGWVKMESYTEPRTNLFRYFPWTLKQSSRSWQLDKAKGREQGKTVVGLLNGCDNRDQAQALVGTEIWVARSVLPKPRSGEYYWSDLEGLQVSGENGVALGSVSHLFATGSNDVLVVMDEKCERMIPFIVDDVILSIDLEAGLIKTNWDPDF